MSPVSIKFKSKPSLMESEKNLNTPPRSRKNFPETWIWDDINKEGLVKIYIIRSVLFFCVMLKSIGDVH